MGGRSAQPAHLIDIVPTLAGVLGLTSGASEFEGIDLLPYVDGRRPSDVERPIFVQRPFYSEGRPEVEESGREHAVRVGRWKLVEAPQEGRRELYDLSADPGEMRNLVTQQPERAEALSALLAEWRSEQQGKAAARDLSVPEEAVEGLRALGYMDESSNEVEEDRR